MSLPPFLSPNCIDVRRSPIELPIECLLIAIGAQQFPAGEAYQVRCRVRPMNGAHQLGRAVDLPPVPRLAEPNTHWCEIHDQEVKKGADCRDQRDEQDTL